MRPVNIWMKAEGEENILTRHLPRCCPSSVLVCLNIRILLFDKGQPHRRGGSGGRRWQEKEGWGWDALHHIPNMSLVFNARHVHGQTPVVFNRSDEEAVMLSSPISGRIFLLSRGGKTVFCVAAPPATLRRKVEFCAEQYFCGTGKKTCRVCSVPQLGFWLIFNL